MNSLGQALRFLRDQSGMGITQLGEHLQISPSTICNLEAGRRMPSLDMLGKFCLVFGLTLSQLFHLEEVCAKRGSTLTGKRLHASRVKALTKLLKLQQATKFLSQANKGMYARG